MLASEWLGLEPPQAATCAPAEFEDNYDPDAWLYRQRTISMLQRYMQLSMETGRLPSLLGREFFRSHVTCYRAGTFEEVVIFVIDMERSLDKVDEFSRMILARMVLQEYTQDEFAVMLGCSRRSVRRHLEEALDKLSAILLSVGLLLPEDTPKGDAEMDAQDETEADLEAELEEVP
jgi:DNA-directed RNA polymerase specialized sigma24 family protein